MAQGYLTIDEVAERLKCHPHTVRRWIWNGRLSAVKVGDLVRISEKELSRFIKPVMSSRPNRKKRSNRAKRLLAAMRDIRKMVKPADVELVERNIREAEQPADWSNPFD